jgi:hypothetical protein
MDMPPDLCAKLLSPMSPLCGVELHPTVLTAESVDSALSPEVLEAITL